MSDTLEQSPVFLPDADPRPAGSGGTTMLPAASDTIDNLEILEPIASGGMACVYKAIHRELEVLRAVKVLKPGYTEENRQRFQTEAKLAANLHYPNIVQIYNVGLWNDTLPYIEMEYVDGLSLQEILRERGKIPMDAAAAIACVVCDALEFAGKQTFTVYGKSYQGLVHRDIKPANILLPLSGIVKLTDFGIALPGSVSIHTLEPTMLGTFPYASPEQINCLKLDHRSDIYSLGTVLYEMIAGVKAFPQKTMPDLIRLKLNDKYPTVRSLVAGVPPSLANVISRSIRFDRNKRFQTIGELRDALDAVIRELSVHGQVTIIRDYLQSTARGKRHFPYQPSRARSSKRFFFGTIIAATAMGLAMLGIITAFNERAITEPPAVAGVSPPPPAGNMPLSAGAAELPAVREQPPVNIPRPAVDVSPREYRAKTAGSLPAENHLEIGLSAFAQKNYSSAINHLEKALAVEKDRHTIDLVQLHLLESFLNTRNTQRAYALAQTLTIDDGYFYLLQGRAFNLAGDYEQSERALHKAQTRRSVFRKEIQEDAVFYWAINRELFYERKPNAENRAAVLNAWKNFRKAFCGDSRIKARCTQAEEKIARFSR